MTSAPIIPVILSGGSGTRLWPMSREERPKQFLALTGAATMFELTLARVLDEARFAAPIIVANARHAELVQGQLAGRAATLLLEPCARNTAPAIALAALVAEADATLLVMPSDHVVDDVPAFLRAVDLAAPLARDGWLVTFGIEPDHPATGYGYIRAGDTVADGVHWVERFIEKPEAARATAMLAEGRHLWNAGIFLFRADAYLAALAAHAPDVLAAATDSMALSGRSGTVAPDPAAFARAPSISVDYAVMERAERVAVVPTDFGWSDLGSWDALHALSAGGDAHDGDVIAIDTANCLLRSDGIRIAAIGVSDLIVVASGDNVLIMPKGRSQEVKRVVERLGKKA